MKQITTTTKNLEGETLTLSIYGLLKPFEVPQRSLRKKLSLFFLSGIGTGRVKVALI